MRRLTLLTLAFVCCCSLTAFAQQASPSPDAVAAPRVAEADQPSKEQLLRLFEVMQIRSQMDSMLKMMPQAIQQQMQSQMDSMEANLPAGSKMTPEQKEALGKLTAKYMDRAMRLYPVDEMMNDMVEIYQHHLTRDDVDAIIVFYQSPAGQHLLSNQPAMMKEILPITMTKMQERSSALTSEFMKELAQTMQDLARPANK